MTANQFKSILDNRGLSYSAVSKEIGVSPSTLTKFLRNDLKQLRKSKYYRLCMYLNIPF
jgi:transcriptional regulator with XRE-family HTH domain